MNLNYENNSLVLEKNIINNLNFEIFHKKFDIIFMDPPFKEKDLNSILINIIKNDMLNAYGVIIIHRHKKEKDILPNKFKIIEEKIYGISRIIFGSYF